MTILLDQSMLLCIISVRLDGLLARIAQRRVIYKGVFDRMDSISRPFDADNLKTEFRLAVRKTE